MPVGRDVEKLTRAPRGGREARAGKLRARPSTQSPCLTNETSPLQDKCVFRMGDRIKIGKMPLMGTSNQHVNDPLG
jgi:hypothetical protein